MIIPNKFVVHCHPITVRIEEYDTNGSRYGYYNDAKEEIVVFRKVRVEDEMVDLTETQMECTFLHELIHLLQFHIKGVIDETEAQGYAGLLLEYLKTKE